MTYSEGQRIAEWKARQAGMPLAYMRAFFEPKSDVPFAWRFAGAEPVVSICCDFYRLTESERAEIRAFYPEALLRNYDFH